MPADRIHRRVGDLERDMILDAWASRAWSKSQLATAFGRPIGTLATVVRAARLAGDPRAAYRAPRMLRREEARA